MENMMNSNGFMSVEELSGFGGAGIQPRVIAEPDAPASASVNPDRAGRWRSNLSGEAAFDSFVPVDLQDVTIEYDGALASRLANAEFELGNLREAYAALDDESRIAVAGKLADREASASWNLSAGKTVASPIMGGNLFPALSPIAVFRAPEDQAEVDNLREAIGYAMDPFDDLPVSRRLLSRAHFLVTQGPRYEKKYPGEVRWSPAWMGEADAPLAKASFVFPAADDLEHGISQLEHFIHGDEGRGFGEVDNSVEAGAPSEVGGPLDLGGMLVSGGFGRPGDKPDQPSSAGRNDERPVLEKVALAHYQFLVLHPFIDGNGRVARILTNLMLRDAGFTAGLVLPVAEVLGIRAKEYHDLVEGVEKSGDYEAWVGFFLDVIRNAAVLATGVAREAAGER